MSNLDKWNRKDASAENTISKIMNIYNIKMNKIKNNCIFIQNYCIF